MKRRCKAYKKTASMVNETAISMYESLGSDRIGFLLESNDRENGRFTFMGIEPEEVIHSDKNSLVIERTDGTREVLMGNPREQLKRYYDEFEVIREDDVVEFLGGLVGSIGYDYIRYTEELPDENEDEIGIETIQLMLASKFIAVDHVAETMTAVVLDDDTVEGGQRAIKEAEELLMQARKSIHEKEIHNAHDGKILKKSDTLQQYADKVNKMKAYIRDGHIFQGVPSQRWTIQTKTDGFDLYKELRKINPSPYLFYFRFRGFELIGSSPEMLVKQTGTKVYTCPIAGSRPRGRNEKEDEALEKELLVDEKERAEHVMLVDLARNDMGKIAKIGSVKVPEYMKVQKYSHIMHITSLVEGQKRKDQHPLDLLSSFLPAGTLSGAPKIRAMEIIDELETVRRGIYAGATGYLGFNGNMNFCITIRTMIKKQEKVYLQAGAGIVADSVPEKEYTECCNKVMALAKTLIKEEEL